MYKSVPDESNKGRKDDAGEEEEKEVAESASLSALGGQSLK